MHFGYLFGFLAATGCFCHVVHGSPQNRNASVDLLVAASHNDHAGTREAILRNADLEWTNGNGNTPLHMAASDGKVDVMAGLLVSGADKEAVDGCGNRPLHLAAANGHLNAVQVLVAAGANLTAEGYQGMTPMIQAARKGYKDIVDLLWVLLHYQPKKSPTPYEWIKALEEAVKSDANERVAQLIARGADIENKDKHHPLLNYAAVSGSVKSMSVLLKAGAVIDALDSSNCTSVHHASKGGYIRGIAMLAVAGADLHIACNGKTPIEFAGDDDTASFLRSLGASKPTQFNVN